MEKALKDNRALQGQQPFRRAGSEFHGRHPPASKASGRQAVRKTHLLHHFMPKCDLLPNQARDKHRKALKKKCVCRRLAYAAAKLLKQQQEQDDQKRTQGALTGPTLAGCRYGSSSSSSSSKTAEGGGKEAGGGSASASKLTLMFNESLLGGEGLMLRPFDANETGGWLDSRGNGLKDSNGAMVCTVDPTCKEAPNHECGNTTTCQCQSWNFIKSGCCGADPKHPGCPANGFCNMTNFWYCEVGPGTVNAFLSHFQCSVYQDRLGTDIGKVEG